MTTYDISTERARLKLARSRIRKIRKESPDIYRGVTRNPGRYLHPGLRDLIRSAMKGFDPKKEGK